MTDFFEIFNPGLRYTREQQDAEKLLVVRTDQGGTGPRPLDLDSGAVVLRLPGSSTYPAAMETPEVPPTDDKDWTFVLERPCLECGFASGEVDVHELPELVRAATAPWREVLARPDVAVRPDPVVWSPLEYACHVRDVLRLFAERATLIRSEDNPVFANWDQDATAIAKRYRASDPAEGAAAIAAAAEANAAEWAAVTEDEWGRPGTRSNGSAFTLATLGQYFLHDLRHHLHDVGAA